MTEYHCFKHF